MEKAFLIELLCKLSEGIKDDQSFSEDFAEKLKILRTNYDLEPLFEDASDIIDNLILLDKTVEYDYITISLSIFYKLENVLEKTPNEILSVQQTKNLKKHLNNLVHIGICTKLLPNLPRYAKSHTVYDNGDIFYNYNILKTTTIAICDFLNCPILRLIILPDNLQPILVASYQIAYCPLKKPSTNSKGHQKNVITEKIYTTLIKEKDKFDDLLHHLQETIHPGIFVKETMAIFYANTPHWFKKIVSQNLTTIIKSKNGIENISTALLDGASNDSNHTWKILDVITKLILSCKTFPDFKENLCNQLISLLNKVSEDNLVYERIYIHCTKSLYNTETDLAKDALVRPLVSFLVFFTYKTHKFEDNENITNKLKQTARILHSLFIENSVELKKLPVNLLSPVLEVIFRFFTLTRNTSFKSTCSELQGLLQGYLVNNSKELSIVFDIFLFSLPSTKILKIRNDIALTIADGDVLLSSSQHSISYSVSESSDALLELLKAKHVLRVKLFGYLLNCLINKDKYFKKASEDLLSIENEFMNEHLERTLIVYKLLAELAEDKNVQKIVTEDPDEIIKYANSVLSKSLELKTHAILDTDSEAFQSLFTVLMILQNLTKNCSVPSAGKYKILVEPLHLISEETKDKETQNIIRDILEIIDKGNVKPTRMFIEEVKSELDKALEDICDPLLPIRGHGLMTLAKLVEKKDENIMERKQYVLNIFQQNLKAEDSYIYLNAINGLAALGDVFPDTILNILCDEYSDTSKKHNDDGHEVRMKLGEALVRVTKILGDMAPKYKPLLLNTFLNGAKDEDDLIRASSLSNLGEICRVLGYKLGTIITEVLVCVHAVISTDKSPQARRAAVTVLRQLFLGLESEMIAFLKEDILPIYRSLKEIYHTDKDDVMRLQAQLALEELNENMKTFVLPMTQLHTEKKIIMLN